METSANSPGADGAQLLGSGNGVSLRAEYENWRYKAEGTDLVPESPTRQGVVAVRIPPPTAPLPPDITDAEAARWLMACYVGAVRTVFGEVVRPYGRQRLEDTPVFKSLKGAVGALREHSLPPADWALWSCSVWKRKDTKRPPIQWVWGAARIEERRGWYRSEATADDAVTLVLPDKARALWEDWSVFNRLLWQHFKHGGLTEREVDALLASALGVAPADGRAEYAQRLLGAKQEVMMYQARMRQAAQGGVWLW